MSNMKKFYLTTAIPYVNGKPHIGHALEYFQADTIRNYYKITGFDTLLLSGADENALKNVQAAEKEGIAVQQFLDQNSKIFKDAYEFLGVKLDVFQRGSDQKKHWPGVQKLWELCNKSGDIYKKSYQGLYCVGCESFKTEAELVAGLCEIHKTKPEQITEENYFFKLSRYQDELIKLIESNEFKITPENKRQETISFIKSGLEDFSISRSNERAKGVGVPIPNDPTQKIYVWFDALNIYMTGIGFGTDEQTWGKWWPADLHIIGKDIYRFHTVYWPAMLLSAGIPLPKQILIHSFVTSGGQKMSKSIGNVIDPFEVVEKYGLEPVRYYLLSQIPLEDDGDFTHERFKEVYNADLANGLGNLVARIAKLCERCDYEVSKEQEDSTHQESTLNSFNNEIENFNFTSAISNINHFYRQLDVRLSAGKPWEIKDDEELKKTLDYYVYEIIKTTKILKPFLPETSEKILNIFKGKVKSSSPLFPRING